MNPPFGTRRKGADLEFLQAAFQVMPLALHREKERKVNAIRRHIGVPCEYKQQPAESRPVGQSLAQLSRDAATRCLPLRTELAINHHCNADFICCCSISYDATCFLCSLDNLAADSENCTDSKHPLCPDAVTL